MFHITTIEHFLVEEESPLVYEMAMDGFWVIRNYNPLIAGGSILTLKQSCERLFYIFGKIEQKRGILTTEERVKVRCIGALGNILKISPFPSDISGELRALQEWLFPIAVTSNSEQLGTLIAKRADFALCHKRGIIKKS